MNISVSQIPFEVDVWAEIDNEISTGMTEVRFVKFSFSIDIGLATLDIHYQNNGESNCKIITLDEKATIALVTRLCQRFNIPLHNLNSLDFTLSPGDFPMFTVKLWPIVNDVSTLNRTKSRMNPKTID